CIIDSLTLAPWNNLEQNHGQLNLFYPPPDSPAIMSCRSRTEAYFVYPFNNPPNFTNLLNWIRDTVPVGDFIAIYSWLTYPYSNSPADLNNLMTYLGCPQWPPADNAPFSFVVKKGEPNIIDTIVQGGVSAADSAFLSVSLVG